MTSAETTTDEPLSAWEQKIGRRLSAYERRIRLKRTDVWQRVFGGAYRFLLPMAETVALEEELGGKSICTVSASIPRDNLPSPDDVATRAEVLATIRYGLIGGGMAVVEGKQIAVTPTMAAGLVEKHLGAAPLVQAWPIARQVLHAIEFGRPSTPEEYAAFSVPSGPPIVPAWAWEAAA